LIDWNNATCSVTKEREWKEMKEMKEKKWKEKKEQQSNNGWI
jgi:hypothetical protein